MRVGTHGAQQLRPDLTDVDPGARRLVEHHPQRLGVRDERLAERDRGAGHPQQPVPGGALVGQRAGQQPDELVVPAHRGRELRQGEQRLVGVRDVREGADELVGPVREHRAQVGVGQQALGAVDVGHAGAGQPPRQRRAPARHQTSGRNRCSSKGVTCERYSRHSWLLFFRK